MNIKEITIKNLYGYMDKYINFQNSISILVGINGSGKTSILNIINWLLRPNIGELCLIEFESIELKFEFKQDEYILTVIQNNFEIIFNLENKSKRKKYNPIKALFRIHPKKLTKNEPIKQTILNSYRSLRPEEHEKETWNFLFYELQKPIIITLDRNLYTEEGEEFRYQPEYPPIKIVTRRIAGRSKTPLDKVKSLLIEAYNIYRSKVIELHESFREKIMLSAFDDIFTENEIKLLLERPKPTINEIDNLKEKFINFFSESPILKSNLSNQHTLQNAIRKVNSYFDKFKKLLQEDQNKKRINDTLYTININQFEKLNSLVAEFKLFEENKNKLFSSLREFLEILNSFLKDSSKELYFNIVSSEIKFRILDKNDKEIEDGRDIVNLSSGEKQILILLTYIKYSQNQKVFIIDEPELSLHPKWQGDFLDAVERLKPKDSQLIIATHSPELIGTRKDFCTVLLPYNI